MSNIALNRTVVTMLTNKSGGAHAQGDVCIISGANASAVINTTTSGYAGGQIAVCLDPGGVANDAIGSYAVGGFVSKVNLSSSASLGDLFKTHTVAKQAVRHATPIVSGDFGMVLETGASPSALLFGSPAGGAGGGGSIVYLNTFTASGAASLDINSDIDDTYPEYEIRIRGIIPSVDDVSLYLRASIDGDASYISSSDYRWALAPVYSQPFFTGQASDNDTSIHVAFDLGTDTGENVVVIVRLRNPRTSNYKLISFEADGYSEQPYYAGTRGGGVVETASKLDAIQLLCSSGNITGTADLYGVKNS